MYDGLGRVRFDQQRLPGDSWSEVETRYLPGGSVEQVSDRHAARFDTSGTLEVGAPARDWTPYSGYDALQRPERVTAPDGKPTTFEYFGIRKTVTTFHQVARTLGSRQHYEPHGLYDLEGRLAEVFEPSVNLANGGFSQNKITYGYDAGGRLEKVATGGQTRLFDYDGRGFLGSEGHPEMAKLDAEGRTLIEYQEKDSLESRPDRRRRLGSQPRLRLRRPPDPCRRTAESHRRSGPRPLLLRPQEPRAVTRTGQARGHPARQPSLRRPGDGDRAVRVLEAPRSPVPPQRPRLRRLQPGRRSPLRPDVRLRRPRPGHRDDLPKMPRRLHRGRVPTPLDACTFGSGERTILYSYDRGYLSSVSSSATDPSTP